MELLKQQGARRPAGGIGQCGERRDVVHERVLSDLHPERRRRPAKEGERVQQARGATVRMGRCQLKEGNVPEESADNAMNPLSEWACWGTGCCRRRAL